MTRLNVVNGMAMLSYLTTNKIEMDGEVVPFNEGMCDGETVEDIFSGEFEMERCIVHGVGVEEYEDIVINPLAPLFTVEYDELHLFFDEDMFCQINLITLLAYLDSNSYDGNIALHLIDYDFNEGKHRLFYEFMEFKRMIDEKDYQGQQEMLSLSLEISKVMEKARQQQNIIF